MPAMRKCMKMSKDRVGGTLLLAFFLGYGLLSQDIHLLPVMSELVFNARTLPYTLTVLGIVLAVSLIAWPSAASSTTSSTKPRPGLQLLHWWRFISFLVLMSIYGFMLRPLGFISATSMFLLCGFLLLGERRATWLFGVTFFIAFGFWALLNYALGVFIDPWPIGLSASR